MDAAPGGNRFTRLIDRVNAGLFPVLGPAQLGRPGEPPAPVLQNGGACPLCGRAMDEHVIDRASVRTMLHCPA